MKIKNKTLTTIAMASASLLTIGLLIPSISSNVLSEDNSINKPIINAGETITDFEWTLDTSYNTGQGLSNVITFNATLTDIDGDTGFHLEDLSSIAVEMYQATDASGTGSDLVYLKTVNYTEDGNNGANNMYVDFYKTSDTTYLISGGFVLNEFIAEGETDTPFMQAFDTTNFSHYSAIIKLTDTSAITVSTPPETEYRAFDEIIAAGHSETTASTHDTIIVDTEITDIGSDNDIDWEGGKITYKVYEGVGLGGKQIGFVESDVFTPEDEVLIETPQNRSIDLQHVSYNNVEYLNSNSLGVELKEGTVYTIETTITDASGAQIGETIPYEVVQTFMEDFSTFVDGSSTGTNSEIVFDPTKSNNSNNVAVDMTITNYVEDYYNLIGVNPNSNLKTGGLRTNAPLGTSYTYTPQNNEIAMGESGLIVSDITYANDYLEINTPYAQTMTNNDSAFTIENIINSSDSDDTFSIALTSKDDSVASIAYSIEKISSSEELYASQTELTDTNYTIADLTNSSITLNFDKLESGETYAINIYVSDATSTDLADFTLISPIFINTSLAYPLPTPISDEGLSTGALIGIIVGSVAGAILIGLGAFLIIRSKKQNQI